MFFLFFFPSILKMASPTPVPEILPNPVFLLIVAYSEDHCSFQLFFYASSQSGRWSFLFWLLHSERKAACCHEILPSEAEGGRTSALRTRSSRSGRCQSCNELHYCSLFPASLFHVPVAGMDISPAAPVHILQQGARPCPSSHLTEVAPWGGINSRHPCHLSRHGIPSWTQAEKGSRGHFSCLARVWGTLLYSVARGNSPARLKPPPWVEFHPAKLCCLPWIFLALIESNLKSKSK